MIMLGLDTATSATAVGLRLADGSVLEARDDPGEGSRPGHATRLLGLAHRLLEQAGVEWNELERIAVGVGPGTFTGLRIGVASAHGLAQSLGVTLVAVSSLHALAHMAAERAARDGAGVLAAIDARRGELFAAAYRDDAEILAPGPLAPSELANVFEEARTRAGLERWIAVGDGVLRYPDALTLTGVQVPEQDSPLHRVSGTAICALGATAPVGGDPAAVVLPDYRRRPDAELALEGAPVR